MKNMGAWQLMLASAAIVPIVAMAVIFWENLQSDGNESVTEFVKWNKNQLKTYGVGVLLLIIIVGALVMAAAAICGVLVNSIFLTKAALKNRD